MSSLFYRLLSLVFALSYHLQTGRWLIGIVLGWWGLVVEDANPSRAHLLWWITVGLFVVTFIAQAFRYVIFRRDGRGPSRSLSTVKPVMQGTATGDFTKPSRWGIGPAVGFNIPVQVRWKHGYRPPCLVALAPANLDVAYGYEECQVYSEWYPGSKVEPGWFWVGGREFYGLRLSFAGRSLLLSLAEDDLQAVQEALAG
jgi:hypothetical protein